MKKTTKILLVLAAVVAMTIGAVSTVMAAEISDWITIDESKKVYQAKDENGELIVRGWAEDEGRWYFFDESYMLFNAFVTWKDDVYYLDGTGCMAVGWQKFGKTDKVIYDKATEVCDNIVEGFPIADEDAAGEDIFVDVWGTDDTKAETYDVLWCYFDEHGVMANHEWVQAPDGLWYFMYGAYCIMDDYHVAIDLNQDGDMADATDGFYGFGKNGNMLVDWVPYDVTEGGVNDSAVDGGKPYEGTIAGTAAKTTTYWTYYHANGKHVDKGWEPIDNKWCFFVEDETLEYVAVTNVFLDDTTPEVDNDYVYRFYIDEKGYMVEGEKTFNGGSANAGTTWDLIEDTATSDADFVVTTSGAITVAKNGKKTFCFSTDNGVMLTGIIGKYYYYDNEDTDADEYIDKIYTVVKTNLPTGQAVTVTETSMTALKGEKLTNSFFLQTEKADGTEVFYYFEAGKMIKDDTVAFGDAIIAINADGILVTDAVGKEVKIDGVTYKYNTEKAFSLTLDGNTFNGVVKK